MKKELVSVLNDEIPQGCEVEFTIDHNPTFSFSVHKIYDDQGELIRSVVNFTTRKHKPECLKTIGE